MPSSLTTLAAGIEDYLSLIKSLLFHSALCEMKGGDKMIFSCICW